MYSYMGARKLWEAVHPLTVLLDQQWNVELVPLCANSLSKELAGPVIRIARSTGACAFSWSFRAHRQLSKWVLTGFFSTVNTVKLLQCQAPVVRCTHVLESFIAGRFCASLKASCSILPKLPHLKKRDQRLFS